MRTFTRKTNRVNGVGGDKVRAADVNDLQQALEDMQTGDLTIPVSAVEGIPEDVTQVANMRIGIYNVLDYDATGDGVTDDTAAIQAAIDAAGAAGGGTVYFPAGRYLVSLRDGFTMHSAKYAVAVNFDNIRLKGDGDNSVIVRTDEHVNGHYTFFVTGAAKNGVMVPTATIAARDFNVGYSNFDWYEIDPVAAGAGAIVTATAGDAANFAVDDFVCIRAGQVIAGSSQTLPDAEINQVTAVDAGTGTLTLKYRNAKPYVQEYYADTNKNTATTTSVTAYPAILGVARVTDDIISNFTATDLRFEISASTTRGSCFSLQQVVGVQLRDITTDTINGSFQANGPYRFMHIENVRATQKMTVNNNDYVSGDKCCGDLTVRDCLFQSYGTKHGYVHMNEGTYNITFDGVRFRATDADSALGFYHASGRGYNHQLINCDFESGAIAAQLQISNIDGLRLDGNRHRGAATAYSLTECSNVRIGVNDTSSAAVFHRDSATTGGVVLVPRVISRWCKYDATSPRLIGYIPRYGILTEIKMFVDIAYNAGSPTIQVGTVSGASDFQPAAQAVGTGGWFTPAVKSTSMYLQSSGYDAYAHITPDGSSAGRVLVILTYLIPDYLQ